MSENVYTFEYQIETNMRIQNANDLKPALGEISQIQTLTADKKIMHWSIYFSNGVYNLVKGYIFHERQNHEIFASNKSYDTLVKSMNKY